MNFKLSNRLAGTLKLRVTERHRNDDYAFSENANTVYTVYTVYTVNEQTGHDGWPILVQTYTPEPATLSLVPSATPDGKDSVYVIHNINSSKPTQGWNHIMSLVRWLTLRKDNTLRIEPTPGGRITPV